MPASHVSSPFKTSKNSQNFSIETLENLSKAELIQLVQQMQQSKEMMEDGDSLTSQDSCGDTCSESPTPTTSTSNTRHQLETKLQMYQNLISSAGIFIGINELDVEGKDLVLVMANKTLQGDLLHRRHLPSDQVVPEDVRQVKLRAVAEKEHWEPGVADLWYQNAVKAHETGMTQEFRFTRPMVNDEGESTLKYLHFLTTLTPLGLNPLTGKPHFSFICTDVTQLTDTISQFKETERFLRTILNIAPVTMYTHRSEDNVTDWVSPHVCELLNIPKIYNEEGEVQMLERFDWTDYLHPDDLLVLEKEDRLPARLPEPDTVEQGIQRIIRPDGQIRWVYFRKIRFDRADGTLGHLSVLTDVTEMEMAKLEMEKALKIREEILANVSHEMRTPLNGIQGHAYLLLHDKSLGPVTSQQQEVLKELRDCTENLGVIVEDLLTLSKADAGKIVIKDEAFDLKHSIDAHVKIFSRRAVEGGKILNVDWSESLLHRLGHDVLVVSDLGRLKQCLSNLLSNALKFTPEGGNISISVDLCHEEVILPIPLHLSNHSPTGSSTVSSDSHEGVVSSLPPVISTAIIHQLRHDERYFSRKPSTSPRRSRGGLTPSSAKDSYFMPRNSPHVEGLSILPTLIVEFTVKDDGIGISPEDLPKLFHAFSQVHDDDCLPPLMTKESSQGSSMAVGKRRNRGTGLGLAISKKLAVLMGGNISASSQGKGHGSTFTLKIPFKLLDPGSLVKVRRADVSPSLELDLGLASISRTSSEEPPSPDTPEQPLRILLVEDNVVNIKIMVRLLAMLGYVCQGGDNVPITTSDKQRGIVEVAMDGEEAVMKHVECLRENKEYDLVFMDLQLPKLDGFAAAMDIIQSSQMNGVTPPKIVALSATCLDSDREKCEDLGMIGFLSKPLKIQDLRNILRSL